MIELNKIFLEDCRQTIARMPDDFLDCIVTSPPYWRKQRYDGLADDALGWEAEPEEYIENLVEIFRILKPKLKKTATIWINIGDTYNSTSSGWDSGKEKKKYYRPVLSAISTGRNRKGSLKLQQCELVGIPWMFAFAMRKAGYLLICDNIWEKSNGKEENVNRRTSRIHEYIFQFAVSKDWWFCVDDIRIPLAAKTLTVQTIPKKLQDSAGKGARMKSIWRIANRPSKFKHFSHFPELVPGNCILAGCPENGIVYDPFAGTGTTCEAALVLGRQFVASELSPVYFKMAQERITVAERKVNTHRLQKDLFK